MGMESFYINLTLCENCSYDLSDLAVISSDIVDNQKILTISYSLFSFFEGISLVYTFIQKYKSSILGVESMKEDINQSINSFLCFFDRLYNLWETKLNNFHSSYGYFLINSNDDFFKSYKKLRKYIKK